MMTAALTTQSVDEYKMHHRHTLTVHGTWPLDAHEEMPFLMGIVTWLEMPQGWTSHNPIVRPWQGKFVEVQHYTVKRSLTTDYKQTTEYSSQIKA